VSLLLHRQYLLEEWVKYIFNPVELFFTKHLALGFPVGGDGNPFELKSRSVLGRNDGLSTIWNVIEDELHHLGEMNFILPLLVRGVDYDGEPHVCRE